MSLMIALGGSIDTSCRVHSITPLRRDLRESFEDHFEDFADPLEKRAVAQAWPKGAEIARFPR